ncbi:Zn finger-containing GTPase- Activating Protein for ARF [Agyrium rufum]|nr:Zn finger-containing GTPase- Activating Protein for ARF [Agyrium rufum]
MWEVDPETKSKLLALQKLPGNSTCIDCPAAAPQWASPKLGIFMCLDCAGMHRGLGVHISFVRSIQMDSFKVPELKRMEMGGNTAWRSFWEEQQISNGSGRRWDDVVEKQDRYMGEEALEWKERLTAKVEGREYVPVPRQAMAKKSAAPVRTALGNGGVGSRTNIPQPRSGTPNAVNGGSGAMRGASRSPAISPGVTSQKEQNETYFARLGNANATRSADLAPSQGGKYAGFGSGPPPPSSSSNMNGGGGVGGLPDMQNLTQDPLGTLTKGLGWFGSTVTKSAKGLNETWIQPTAQKIAASEVAAQAQRTAAMVGKNAVEGLNRFVEGDEHGSGGYSRAGTGAGMRKAEPERKDFWDSFGGGGEVIEGGLGGRGMGGLMGGSGPGAGKSSSGAIGTAAMKGNATAGGNTRGEKKDDEWEEW